MSRVPKRPGDLQPNATIRQRRLCSDDLLGVGHQSRLLRRVGLGDRLPRSRLGIRFWCCFAISLSPFSLVSVLVLRIDFRRFVDVLGFRYCSHHALSLFYN